MRLLSFLRPILFVFVSALIMVVASERVFWYYTNPDPAAFLELGLFYSVPVFWLFYSIERYRVSGIWSLVLAVPIFGYLVEGFITPVVYSGGPNPFFPVWFTAWHGGLGAILLWFFVRRWLVQDDRRSILLTSIGFGVFWGVWSTTNWLPENLNDPELAESAPRIRSTADFALYAIGTTVVLIGGHWILGRGLWMPHFRWRRYASIPLALVIIGVVVAYTVILPWAAPMFAVLVASVVVPLRRHRRTVGPETATIFEQLNGSVPAFTLALLGLMPLVATATYGALMMIEPPLSFVRAVFFYGIIGGQTVLAGLIMLRSWLRVYKNSARMAGPCSLSPGMEPNCSQSFLTGGAGSETEPDSWPRSTRRS